MLMSAFGNLFSVTRNHLGIITGALFLSLIRRSSTVMSYEPNTHSVAYVTVPNNDVAKKIAHGLVKSKLAACVNIIPQITSVYEWKGEINEDSEILLMIKTQTNLTENLTKYVRENHPYEVCEVITLPIAGGNPPYLSWISEVLEKKVSTEKTETCNVGENKN